MAEEHNHVHDHRAESGEARSGKFVLSMAITGATLIAEIVGGLLTGSLALLSDAAHVFLDIFALALAYGATRLASRKPSGRHTYGFHRMSVIAAFINGTTLVVVALEIFREAISRLAIHAPSSPVPCSSSRQSASSRTSRPSSWGTMSMTT